MASSPTPRKIRAVIRRVVPNSPTISPGMDGAHIEYLVRVLLEPGAGAEGRGKWDWDATEEGKDLAYVFDDISDAELVLDHIKRARDEQRACWMVFTEACEMQREERKKVFPMPVAAREHGRRRIKTLTPEESYTELEKRGLA
jgi:hypothetical protein